MKAPTQLSVSNLHAFYGESHILHGIDLEVNRGELVTLLGRNGSGRSTTLKAIMNMVGRRTGSITIRGRETLDVPAHRIARLGVGFCPEDRGIFASLSVEENLLLPPSVASGGMTLDEIYSMFPNLCERRRSQGTRLSGGEQQMLAIGRALMSSPKLLLLDEPSMGLAPNLVLLIFDLIKSINEQGVTILLIEQNANIALSIAKRAYVLETGNVVLSGESASLRSDPAVQRAYLGG